MYLKTFLICPTVFLSFLFVFPISVSAQNGFQIGTITSVKGEVDIISLVNGSRRDGADETAILESEQIRTGVKSGASLILLDGTHVDILPFSIINVRRASSVSGDGIPALSLRMLSGRVRVRVPSLAGGERKFFLKTPTLIASVRGTDIGLVAVLKDARIVVYEGEVEVGNRSPSVKRSYILRTRQTARVKEGEPPSEIKYLDMSVLENILDQYEITRQNKIQLQVREPEMLFDRMVKKR